MMTLDKSVKRELRLAEMHALAQRIARLQQRHDVARVGVDHRDFEREPRVLDLAGERLALAQQPFVARREIVDAAQQLAARRLAAPSSLRRRARGRERIERDIDAIEIAEILAAILQVIDDLQRGAQRIVRRPGGAALAMHIEHEAADRHRRIAAVVDEVVPVPVAQLGHVHAERGEQVLRVARRQAALGERVAQPHGFRDCRRRCRAGSASSRSSCASFSSGSSVA